MNRFTHATAYAALLASSLASSALAAPAHERATQSANSSIVSSYMNAVFVEHDLANVERFWGADMIQHNPTMPNGLDVLRGIIGKIGPEFRYEQGAIAAQGNLVMVHGRYTGWGPKPMVAVDIFRLDHGKIVEHWDVMQEDVPAAQSANGHAMFPAR